VTNPLYRGGFITPSPLVPGPRNAPPDDLDSYLDLWQRSASAYASSYGLPNGAEWDINLPIPQMRTLEGLFGVGDALGFDSASYATVRVAPPYQVGDIKIVPALWAQRGLNASGIRTVTDSAAGPVTLANLRAFVTRHRLGGPAPSIVDRGHVSMSAAMEQALASLTQVPDVARESTYAPPSPPSTVAIPSTRTGAPAAGWVALLAVALGAGLALGRSR